MIFVVETEEQSLLLFEDERSVIAHCEGLDVEAEVWLFWNDKGQPLEAEFIIPNRHSLFTVSNGEYRLVLATGNHHVPLLEALENVLHVESEPPLSSVEAIRQYLQGR